MSSWKAVLQAQPWSFSLETSAVLEELRSVQILGAGSSVRLDNSGGNYDVTSAFSWIKLLRFVGARSPGLTFAEQGASAGWELQVQGSQRLLVDVVGNRAQFSAAATVSKTLRNGAWHWLGFSWSTSDGASFVLDQVDETPNVTSDLTPGGVISTPNQDLELLGAAQFAWRFQELHLFNQRLTATEMIAAIASQSFALDSRVAHVRQQGDGMVEVVQGRPVTVVGASVVSDTRETGDRTPEFQNADVIHITGQSLAEGSSTGSQVSRARDSVIPNWQFDAGFLQPFPLTGGIEEPDGTIGEQFRNGSPVVTTNVAVSGTAISEIDKPSGPFTALLAHVQTLFDLGINRQDLVVCINGETDETNGTTAAAFQALLEQLGSDLDTDIKAITGQTQDVQVVISQTSTLKAAQGGVLVVPMGQYEAAKGANIHLSHAKYSLPFGDPVHVNGEGSKLMAAFEGRACRVVRDEGSFTPLQPSSVAVDGNNVVLTMNVPVAGAAIVKDTTTVAQQTDDGFEYIPADGETPPTIESVTINGATITLALSGPPNLDARIGYARSGAADERALGNIRTDQAIFALLTVIFASSETVTATINGQDVTVSAATDADTTAALLAQAITNAGLGLVATQELSGVLSVHPEDGKSGFTVSGSGTGAADVAVQAAYDWLVHFEEDLPGDEPEPTFTDYEDGLTPSLTRDAVTTAWAVADLPSGADAQPLFLVADVTMPTAIDGATQGCLWEVGGTAGSSLSVESGIMRLTSWSSGGQVLADDGESASQFQGQRLLWLAEIVPGATPSCRLWVQTADASGNPVGDATLVASDSDLSTLGVWAGGGSGAFGASSSSSNPNTAGGSFAGLTGALIHELRVYANTSAPGALP
ncbi:MAG: hypothetical protein AAF851_05640 [Myxococcota bacterium]